MPSMSRSLRRLALLGLLAIGASSAGGQTPSSNVLFHVTYNPSELTLVITPLSGTPAANATVNLAEGFYLKDLFSRNLVAGTEYDLNDLWRLRSYTPSGGLVLSASSTPSFTFAYADDGPNLNLAPNAGSTTGTYTVSNQALFSTSSSLTLDFGTTQANSGISSAFQNSSFTGGTVFVQNTSPYGSVDIGTYTYSVVPEPSTYAAIAGALGLGYAVYRRRRQASAAATA